MVQGEQLDLTCKVSGYPFPTVEWRKDNQEFNTSTRIHITPYEGSPTGKLTIYTLDFDDKGTYSCIASSPKFENETATAEMVIRVKGKIGQQNHFSFMIHLMLKGTYFKIFRVNGAFLYLSMTVIYGKLIA